MAGRRAKSIYGSHQWRALRLAKLRACNWTCEVCGRAGGWLEIHHKIRLADGGAAFPPLDGLEAVCRACHLEAHRNDRAAPVPGADAWQAEVKRIEAGSPGRLVH